MTLRDIISKPMMNAEVFALLSQTSLPTARKQIMMLNEKHNYFGLHGITRKLIPTKIALESLGIDSEYHEKNGTLDYDLENKIKSSKGKK